MNRLLISCTALAVLAGGASAATMKAKYLGIGQNSGSYSINYKSGTYTANVGAGELRHQFDAVDGGRFASQTLKTFCIDIAENVQTNVWHNYSIDSVASAPDGDAPAGHIIGSARAGLIASLYANAITDGLLDNRGSAVGFTDGMHAAAFQLVVWELAFEADGAHGDLTSGEFKVTNSINAGVSAYFSTFLTWANLGTSFGSLRAMTFQGAQDQLIVIPLPAGGMMGLAGLAGIAAIRRRR
jgi:hypothetical protein